MRARSTRPDRGPQVTAVVKAESLTKRFGEVSAVTDLSFVLEAGTITGFLGPDCRVSRSCDNGNLA
jgi:ABC-type lipopolysaccharide export system ATPase subunit